MFADFHCHPDFKTYNWFKGSRYEKDPDRYHPWHIPLPDFHKLIRGDRASHYAQSDLVKLSKSNTKLVFASLYPFEKGFFISQKTSKNTVLNLYKLIGKGFMAQILDTTLFQLLRRLIPGLADKESALRIIAQTLYMDIPSRRVKYLQSNAYDYFQELQDELHFFQTRNKKKTAATHFIPGNLRARKKAKQVVAEATAKERDMLVGEGTYRIVNDLKDLQTIEGNQDIGIILTIEGAHALGSDRILDANILIDRVQQIKKWKERVFFITFAHHFNNNLCGHAHSIPNVATFLLNQDKRMNEGFTGLGRDVIREFLSLDSKNNRASSKAYRIHIDTKHMAAQSRHEYYNEILNPCLNKGDIIPLIASHSGYSGVKTLTELVSNAKKKLETDDYLINKNIDGQTKKFYGWNINLCDEDIEMVVKTGGLIGISFDERILGYHEKKNKVVSIDLFWNNLIAMVDVIVSSDKLRATKKKQAWTVFCIGTDNEGYINPIDKYPTAYHFQDFQRDLVIKMTKEIKKPGMLEKYGIAEADIPNLVKGISFDNAHRFLKKHL